MVMDKGQDVRCTVEEAAELLRQGRLVLVTDDEQRENEGDLVGAAETASRESINFMAMEGRGLICVPMRRERLAALGLGRMVPPDAKDRYRTAFTVSVDAREGHRASCSSQL